MASQAPTADADPVIEVLFLLQEKFDLMDFSGPLQVLTQALHNIEDDSTKAFDITIAGAEDKVLSSAGIVVGSQISFKEAHAHLEDYDVVVIVGGNTDEILKTKSEPLGIISAYCEIQKQDPTRERTLLSVSTGTLLLAQQGILSGLKATTHTDANIKLENLCSLAAQRELTERTDVLDGYRYIVNNLRFEVDSEDQAPYIHDQQPDGRRPSNARKGSMSFKSSNARRESITRRAAMRLGGLRVITSGGNTCGIDAALYLVGALVSDKSAEEVRRLMDYTWTKGLVVDGIDV